MYRLGLVRFRLGVRLGVCLGFRLGVRLFWVNLGKVKLGNVKLSNVKLVYFWGGNFFRASAFGIFFKLS